MQGLLDLYRFKAHLFDAYETVKSSNERNCISNYLIKLIGKLGNAPYLLLIVAFLYDEFITYSCLYDFKSMILTHLFVKW